MGTRRAHAFVEEVRGLAREHLRGAYEAEVVGQWWLAQRGMDHITRDMLASFSTSCLSILPLLALVLWNGRLFLTSILPNVLPTLFALAFSVWAGIPVRIGTAMILAVALGIAVDDTIHFMLRLKRETERGEAPEDAVRHALRHSGRGILYTSVVLVTGFLSMASNDLLAIRDMGVVAAATMAAALAAELYLGPALYLTLAARRSPQPSTASSL